MQHYTFYHLATDVLTVCVMIIITATYLDGAIPLGAMLTCNAGMMVTAILRRRAQ